MKHVTDQQRGKEFITKLTKQQGRQGRPGTHPSWTDSCTARVIVIHKPPSVGTKNFAPATTRLQPKITLRSQHRQSGAEMTILGSLYQNLRVKTDFWINEMITQKLKELKREIV